MTVLTSIWRQLVTRRLWPVAVLLVAALAAVPVLLVSEPDPVPPPTVGAAAATAKADDEAIGDPIVAKVAAEDRSRRRRVLGSRKNPFRPAPAAKKADADTDTDTATVPKSQNTDTTKPGLGGPTTGGSTPPAPTAPVPVPIATPVPKKKTYPKDAVIVRFGDATSDNLERKVLAKLEPLPDAETPLLVYMGLRKKGKEAVFLVDAALEPTGDGECKPHPASCEEIRLRRGETEFFDVVDPESGDILAQYQLDLVKIRP